MKGKANYCHFITIYLQIYDLQITDNEILKSILIFAILTYSTIISFKDIHQSCSYKNYLNFYQILFFKFRSKQFSIFLTNSTFMKLFNN